MFILIKLLNKIIPVLLLLYLAVTPVKLYSQLIIPDTSISFNNILTLPVKILGIDSSKIFSYQFNLTYDTTYLELNKVIKDTDISGLWGKPLTNTKKKGLIRIAAAGEKPIPIEGILFYLSFFPKRKGETVIKVNELLFNEGSPHARYKNGDIKIMKSMKNR